MRTVPLGELAEFIMGQAPPGETCNFVGEGTAFVKAGEFGERVPVIREWTKRPLQLARNGDVLVCVVGATSGKVNLGIDCAIGRSVAAIRPHTNRLEQRFAYYFMQTQTLRLRGGSQGSAQGVITRGMLHNLPVPALTYEEQNRIANILDSADTIRRKRTEAIELVDNLVRSAFWEMFGEPTVNPKQWPVFSLGEIAEVGGGLQVTTARAGYELSMPYLRVANVFRDRLELSEVKEIRVTAAERKRAELREGDVLVVEGHGNPEELGRAAVWNGEIPGCTHQNHLIRVRPDPSKMRSVFLSSFLNSTFGRAQMLSLGKTTSGLNTISTSNVRSIRLLLPPLKLQRDFEQIVRKARCLASRMRRDANEEALFDTLSGLAFAGQLRTEVA